jgi:pimeloyl-ACP methyl ester carboxylesterase
MKPDADLTLRGHARILGDVLETLDLRDVTLVENDTGMAQLLAGTRPERIGRLVISSCEAFDNYPPGLPGKAIALAAKAPGGLNFAMQQLRFKPMRRSPMTFGRMTKRPIPDEWLRPLWTQREIRRDLQKYVGNVEKDVLVEAAERLPTFDKPALVVWAKQDRVMPPEHGRRLAELLPHGRLVEIADSRTLIPLDQPTAFAREIRQFVRESSMARSA